MSVKLKYAEKRDIIKYPPGKYTSGPVPKLQHLFLLVKFLFSIDLQVS